MYHFFEVILKKKHHIYLHFIRLRIFYSKNVNDIIKIIKNICYFNNYKSSDEILTFLIECFTYFPLTDLELQKFSIWEQEYNMEGGITNFVTFTLWISVIESLNNKPRLMQ